MLFNKVILENIGAYRGVNTFDFKVKSPKRTIVLIGGENGSGKTTLLNAIKIGLFGSYAFGYKTENEAYLHRIKEMLNKEAIKDKTSKFRVTLEFSEVENFKRHNFIFYREWKIQSKSIKENIEIVKDGFHLNSTNKEIYQSKLLELMPPHLFDLCFFDGEEISKIINNNQLSEYLYKLIKVVFNLDLFERLEEDLEKYMENGLDQSTLTRADKELINLKNSKKVFLDDLNKIQAQIQELQNKQSYNIGQLQNLKRDFEAYGGLVKEERERLITQINEIENERKLNSNKIKDFIADLLPFYINQELLRETKEQMESEASLQIYEMLKTKLDNKSIENILNEVPMLSNHTDLGKILREKILEKVKPTKNTIIHRASFSQRSQVISMYKKIVNEDKNIYIKLFQINREKLAQLQDLRKKIEINDNTNEFSEMIKKMGLLNQKINKIDQIIQELHEKKELIEAKLMETNSQIVEYDKMLNEYDKTKNSFVISQKVINLSKKFRSQQQQKKLQEIAIESTKMLNKLMRKQNYISNIKIDHISFEVTLLDNRGEKLTIKNLSAGEKELLLLSIIWAVFKCSGRRVPFIFDTLLGRLDKTHKRAVLTDLITACGEQVLLLATDSEISEANYKLIKPYLSHEYTLVFDTLNHRTSIKNYFFKRS